MDKVDRSKKTFSYEVGQRFKTRGGWIAQVIYVFQETYYENDKTIRGPECWAMHKLSPMQLGEEEDRAYEKLKTRYGEQWMKFTEKERNQMIIPVLETVRSRAQFFNPIHHNYWGLAFPLMNDCTSEHAVLPTFGLPRKRLADIVEEM